MEPRGLRYVGFFDILGMSDLILQDHAKAWEVLGLLRSAFNESLNAESTVTAEGDRSTVKFRLSDYLRHFTFSDSILVFTNADTLTDLLSIVGFCSDFFATTFGSCVPIRGAVVHGEFWVNFEHSVFSGPALVNAYRAADDPQWMGLTVDDTVAANLAASRLSKTAQTWPVCQWEIAVKSSPNLRRVNAVNWPTLHKRAFNVPMPISADQLYKAGFDRIFGPFERLDLKVQTKYVNTAAFISVKAI